MSKPLTMPIHREAGRSWVTVYDNKMLSMPEIIEGTAKGWCRKNPKKGWMLEVKKHKPQHTKGHKTRYYYVHDPKKRPLICSF
jgi:hypothetical protein